MSQMFNNMFSKKTYFKKQKNDEIIKKHSKRNRKREKFIQLKFERERTQNGDFSCQALRSGSQWSIGLGKKENSIYLAYLDLIQGAHDFIYIENQFFISKGSNSVVVNNISRVIIDKILQKYLQKKKFVCVILFPLIPGFEGDITQKNGEVLRIQYNYQLTTLSQGAQSIIQVLKREMGSIEEVY